MMTDTRLGTASRGVIVVVVEVVALTLTAYAGFVAFVAVPPGMGGGSQDSSGLAMLGMLALVASVVLPSTGFLCAAYFWRERVWVYRAAGAMGAMTMIWVLLFAARISSP